MKRSKLLWMSFLMSLLLVLGACQKKEETGGAGMEETTGLSGDHADDPNTATPNVSDTPSPTATAATTARVTLAGAPNDTDFSGTVTFTQGEGQDVHVVADFAGVDTPGKHGFHIHETGECDHDPAGKHFSSAGGHFNPTAAEHACPPTDPRHAGDLGNVQVGPNGSGRMELSTSGITLTGANSIVGKAILLHAGEDDCKTQPTGNSGDRLACGVITLEGGLEGGGTTGATGTTGQ